MRLLIIDNYDSFTYNLVQTVGALERGIDLRVVRNDQITVSDIERDRPDGIILSPGPCTPDEAGVCNEVVRSFRGRIPLLGVCLGHLCIGAVHGMTIRRADRIMHGKTSEIHHDGLGLFSGLPNPFTAMRYHSLILDRSTVDPNEFEIPAWAECDDDEDTVVMGLRWKDHQAPGRLSSKAQPEQIHAPLIGVQFHPESFLTEIGRNFLANYLIVCHAVREIETSP